MLPENNDFFVRGEDGEEYGPVGLEELRDWVQENRAGLGTEIRRDEPNAQWHQWQTYPELVALLAEVHVTSPVPGLPGLAIAPAGRRIGAFILDLILINILAYPLLYLVKATSGIPNLEEQFMQMLFQPENPVSPEVLFYAVVSNLISYTVMALYFTGFHSIHGQTPAKALLRLRIVDQSGTNPGPFKAFLRAIVLILSMCFFGLPLLYAFFNPQRRALHDLVANTYVVET
jgi:uncharacterized RDD family membrane protein YckC